MPTNVTLPELGENIESGSIAKVLVKVGDLVKKDQSIIEIETEKAVVEVPSTAAGTVAEIKVKEGDTLNVGEVILVLDAGAEAAEKPKAAAAKEKAEPKAKEPAVKAGPETKKSKAREPDPDEQEEPATPASEKSTREPDKPSEEKAPHRPVAAAPSVRKLAREIGVDIGLVAASSPSGRVTTEDVKAHARNSGPQTAAKSGRETAGVALATSAARLPDFSHWGEITREPMSTIRRKTAERLSQAWTTIPHVTQHDKADITALEKFRKDHGQQAVDAGGKLTATAILVKVLALGLKRFPQFNASIDPERGEVIYKSYYNIGVAVDTDRGLLVPVIKNADEKNLIDLAVELSELSERARTKKVTIEEMQGGCMTITNLGGIGGVAFTPIINPPEVAILGVSRASMEPVYTDGQFVPRLMMPISLSYDHRLIDGADAARFARWLCAALEQPLVLFLAEG